VVLRVVHGAASFGVFDLIILADIELIDSYLNVLRSYSPQIQIRAAKRSGADG
jgi:hypothetical protein